MDCESQREAILFLFSERRNSIMKKQFAAIFAVTAVLGVTTAFAANPFSDVTPDSWAYQAVSQLAASGIINCILYGIYNFIQSIFPDTLNWGRTSNYIYYNYGALSYIREQEFCFRIQSCIFRD